MFLKNSKRRSPPFFFSACLVLINLLILAACGKNRGEAPPLFRIIDHIGRKNVIETPLRNPDPNNPSLAEIAGKYVLEDLGRGENPFFIKKKLRLGIVDHNALLAIPTTQFEFSMTIPPGALLEFAFGIRKDDEIFRAAEGARAVKFGIFLSTDNVEKKIFTGTLELNPKRALIFGRRKIDLSAYAGKPAAFRLTTEGDERALAFWFNPIVYESRSDARFVILVSLDTLRADHLGCYGYKRDTSPNLDALAREGALFANTLAPAPWTLPSHISLMTSLNPINHGVTHTGKKLNSRITTLAEILKVRGFYNVAFTGGGYVSGFFGFHRGFDSYHVLGGIISKDAAAKLYDKASRWITNNKDKNFFLFLHTYQIHNPYSTREPFNRLYIQEGAEFDAIDMTPLGLNSKLRFKSVPEETRQNFIDLYDSEIRFTDESLIKPLIEKLKALGLYDRTMLIVTSDHGEEFFEHGSWLHTHSVYSELVQVPLIVKFFGSRNAGRTVNSLAALMDVMPTVLEELNIKYPARRLDGKSLLSLLNDDEKGDDRIGISDLATHAWSEHIPRRTALIRGPYKFILNEPFSRDDLAYFLIPPPPLAEIEIFDLVHDPGETVNLAPGRPDLVRQFQKMLRTYSVSIKNVDAEEVTEDKDIINQLKSLGYL